MLLEEVEELGNVKLQDRGGVGRPLDLRLHEVLLEKREQLQGAGLNDSITGVQCTGVNHSHCLHVCNDLVGNELTNFLLHSQHLCHYPKGADPCDNILRVIFAVVNQGELL